MALRDDILPLFQQKDWRGCEALLAARSPGDDAEQRAAIAYWRTAVLEGEGRYEDALRFLASHRDDFFSKCLVYYLQANILCRMGNCGEAIETLRKAPFGEEMDRFPALSLEAIFLYCFLLTKSGRDAPPKLLDAIPDDYRSYMFDGTFANKSDILAAIDKRRAAGAPPPLSPASRDSTRPRRRSRRR